MLRTNGVSMNLKTRKIIAKEILILAAIALLSLIVKIAAASLLMFSLPYAIPFEILVAVRAVVWAVRTMREPDEKGSK